MSQPMHDRDAMLDLLAQWTTRGWLRDIDQALVRFLAAETPDMPPALMLAAALVSHQLGRGHVCLDLDITIQDPYMALSLPPEQEGLPEEESILLPKDLLANVTTADWIAAIRHPALTGDGSTITPLVLNGHRLYLYRYWRYEREIEAAITSRLARTVEIAAALPEEDFKATLAALFPPGNSSQTDWQKIACALSARSAFSIITGGPGTGKTTTVVRLLALLQSMAKSQERPLEIRLAAPTGKAAARLKESIAGAINSLPPFVQDDATLKASIPTEVTTLHRLLGTKPDSRAFRHDARNPLPLDVLVIDEGSMISLDMMAAVLQALRDDARLVLLGDKDQLASVEAGSVLGELCRRAAAGHFLPDTIRWAQAVTGEKIDDTLADTAGLALDQHIVMLRESRRFHANSGIGKLAWAINAGDTVGIASVWQQGYADLSQVHIASADDARLSALLLGNKNEEKQGYAAYLEIIRDERPAADAGRPAFDAWAHKVLDTHGRFQLLSVLRKGAYGVDGLNERTERLLAKHQLIRPEGIWYAGRPVIVTQNNYALDLSNGDIGITLPWPVQDKDSGQYAWVLRVAFPDGKGGIRWILPSRLQSTQTVFSLTVHKSQGSEFEHCALLLPPELNPIMTRELIYTGITRGKKWFSLVTTGKPGIAEAAAQRTVQRSGGLFC